MITLNRPERRNALHRDMYPAIRAGLAEFATATDVTCIVVTGAGDAFCSGGDVRDGRRTEPGESPPTVEQAAAALLDDAQLARLLHESPKLTVAAVNGAAVGARLALALACDLRVLAPTARLIPGWRRPSGRVSAKRKAAHCATRRPERARSCLCRRPRR